MYGQNPYFPGMPQNPYMQAPQQPTIPRQEVVKVNGENGARAYQMGANSSALLLDESGELLWVVTTDGAGYKSVGAFDITPHQAADRGVPNIKRGERKLPFFAYGSQHGSQTNAKSSLNCAFTHKCLIFVLRSGRRGRGFKSRHLDHSKSALNCAFSQFGAFLFSCVACCKSA